jgi:hypothetical protein
MNKTRLFKEIIRNRYFLTAIDIPVKKVLDTGELVRYYPK